MVIFGTRYLPAERRPLLAAGSASVNSILTLTVFKHQILIPNPVVNKAAGNRFRIRFATFSMTGGVIDITSSHASSLTSARSVRVDTHVPVLVIKEKSPILFQQSSPKAVTGLYVLADP